MSYNFHKNTRGRPAGLMNSGRSSGANSKGLGSAANKTYECILCNREKPFDQYSTKQQALLAKTGGTCKACNGGSALELECAFCGKVKGLDRFSKSQRRNNNRDDAKCMTCQEQKSRVEPEETYDQDQDSSDSNPGEEESDDDGMAHEHGVPLYPTASASGTRPSASANVNPAWVAQPRSGMSGSSRAGRNGINAYHRARPNPASMSGGSAVSGNPRDITNHAAGSKWGKVPKTPDPNAISILEYGSDPEDDDLDWDKPQDESSDDDSE